MSATSNSKSSTFVAVAWVPRRATALPRSGTGSTAFNSGMSVWERIAWKTVPAIKDNRQRQMTPPIIASFKTLATPNQLGRVLIRRLCKDARAGCTGDTGGGVSGHADVLGLTGTQKAVPAAFVTGGAKVEDERSAAVARGLVVEFCVSTSNRPLTLSALHQLFASFFRTRS